MVNNRMAVVLEVAVHTTVVVDLVDTSFGLGSPYQDEYHVLAAKERKQISNNYNNSKRKKIYIYMQELHT